MMSTLAKQPFRFTGWHMSAILVAFFAVVIAVNIGMARLAGSTFSGVVVENSYDASQQFDRWLDEAAKEQALGWHAQVARQADGHVVVTLQGKGLEQADLTGEGWHPLGQLADRPLTFHRIAGGDFLSDQALPDGRWRLRLKVQAGGHLWRANERL
jgi:nitrogen fixation protein FixH